MEALNAEEQAASDLLPAEYGTPLRGYTASIEGIIRNEDEIIIKLLVREGEGEPREETVTLKISELGLPEQALPELEEGQEPQERVYIVPSIDEFEGILIVALRNQLLGKAPEEEPGQDVVDAALERLQNRRVIPLG